MVLNRTATQGSLVTQVSPAGVCRGKALVFCPASCRTVHMHACKRISQAVMGLQYCYYKFGQEGTVPACTAGPLPSQGLGGEYTL